MKKLIAALSLMATCAVVALTVGVAVAVSAPQEVCAGDKVELSGEDATITIDAPAGFLISAVCIKAGSTQQGCGISNQTFDPPLASITITGTCGKGISHYSLTLVPLPPPPPPPV